MARPGLHNHPKFRRLVFTLGQPVPHVRGYLECLWDVAYENGNAVLGDQTDVELAAQWVGQVGTLCTALLTCGGEGRAGFIEEVLANGNQYAVHDLFDHAPEYVFSRSKREEERQKEKICLHCQSTYRSKYPGSKFCSDMCRSAHWRTETERKPNGNNGNERQSNVQNGTPAPAPAPAPINTTAPKRGRKKKDPLTYTPEFEAWWRTYPRREAKEKAAASYEASLTKLASRPGGRDGAVEWLQDVTAVYAASRIVETSVIGALPHPTTWLNQGRYDDDPAAWDREAFGDSAKPKAPPDRTPTMADVKNWQPFGQPKD